MKRQAILLAGCAFFALGTAAAYADCAEELAQMEAESEGGIAKDGSLAPLEGAETSGGATPEGAGSAAVATSPQDVQAQQQGGMTAAAEAGASSEAGSMRADAVERARAAMNHGDEEGCMQALEEARSS